MDIECLVVGPLETNCYVVWGQKRKALVIDPGADADMILACLGRHGLDVGCYLLTHAHQDHIGALAEISETRRAPVALQARDFKQAYDISNPAFPYQAGPLRPAGPFRMLEDGQSWEDAGLTYAVIGTPGHSPGSLCFHFPAARVLFSGDTLFQGTVGRTDLPGGNGRLLTQSLGKLARLAPETRIMPGHGPQTRLAEEFRSNPFLKKPF